MNPELFFSVIIPTYNRKDFILLALQSVLVQDYKNLEVIIVDDGSTDGTSDVVDTITDPRIHYIKTVNSERGAARNTGIRMAKGDYVTFLDSDDLYYTFYLSTALQGLKKFNYPVFYHQGYEVRSYTREKVRYYHDYNENDTTFLAKGNPLSCLGVFIKREEALMFPFNEDRNLSGSEDWELWIRLAANFGLHREHKICACLILHDERSVYDVKEESLVRRKRLAMEYSFKDARVREVFGSQWKRMNAYADSYNALHLVLAGKIKRGLVHFFKAAVTFPPCIFQRRTLAIFKYVFLSLFGR